MIVSMKKTTVLTISRHRDETLRILRNLGFIHPEAVTPPSDVELDRLRREHLDFSRLINRLDHRGRDIQRRLRSNCKRAADGVERDRGGDEGKKPGIHDRLVRLRKLADEHKVAVERLGMLDREIRETEPLGDFDPQAVRDLAQKGIPIRLFQRSGKKDVSFADGMLVHVLQRDTKGVIYAIIGSGDPEPADRILPLPSRSLRRMREEREDIAGRIEQIERDLDRAVALLPRLREYLSETGDAVRFAETRAGMGCRDDIVYLRGYCPVEGLDAMRAAAREHGWALLIQEPDPDDKTPTLIRHPNWVRPIQAVLDLMGILPGYREVDVSAAFLLFFSLFFAMIVGDAGYGVIFLGLTALARRRWHDVAPAEPFRLMNTLSVCTIAWGLITGNVFGTEWFPALVPWVVERENLMMICFLIGAAHLSVAHAWNAIAMLNSPRALAQVGWIALTWFMFLAARSLILGAEFHKATFVLLGGGLLMVILFMTPARRLKNEWISHAMLPLTVINNFVDVVSYVRLFAVGYATLAVAEAFNSMAVVENMGVTRGLAAALILFCGHALNVVLCALSVLVHGIRLNTLEFSGHIGMQWSGSAYRPFKAAAGEEQA